MILILDLFCSGIGTKLLEHVLSICEKDGDFDSIFLHVQVHAETVIWGGGSDPKYSARWLRALQNWDFSTGPPI